MGSSDSRLTVQLGADVGHWIGGADQPGGPHDRYADVFNPAAGLKQERLVHQPDGKTPIPLRRKSPLEFTRQMMRIHDKRLHPRSREMIKREADERLAKDRHERLG